MNNITIHQQSAGSKSISFTTYIRPLICFPEPEHVFVQVFAQEPRAFWLDSSLVEKGLSRFSFMGAQTGPRSAVITYDAQRELVRVQRNKGEPEMHSETIFAYLKRELAQYTGNVSLPIPFNFCGGFVGYFGYELKRHCGVENTHHSSFPDAHFLFVDQFLAFDHEEQTTYLVFLGTNEAEAHAWFDDMERRLRILVAQVPKPFSLPSPLQEKVFFRLQQSRADYIQRIRDCQTYLTNGESYEICLTNSITTELRHDPLLLYRLLRRRNPAPYAVFLRFDDVAVICSSPERFLTINQDRSVETKPIKGTSPRGRTEEEDTLLYEQLRVSEKDRAENLMIVDLLRNDLGRVCEIGSISVPKLMHVESYTTVHQLVSTIRGILRPKISSIDCIHAAFPGGSMTGAPKIRTLQVLDHLEQGARGIYSGAAGFWR